jgi:hypothetical protein
LNLVVYTAVMAGKKAFEAQIAALDALREAAEDERIAALRKALGQRNNFLAAKAADLVREFKYADLIPELLQAFERFFENPEKTDPQCWAKNAIGRALAALELQEEQVFLRGMRHIQLEPVWGGASDTAGTLRATCALALVQCRDVREPELLAHLVDMLADKDKSVRIEIMHAIEQVGSTSAALLLRERAILGNDEPEVLGACYSGVLSIEGARAIPWVGRFLEPGDEAAAEAALAIAGTHSVEGFEVLRTCLETGSDFATADRKDFNLRAADQWFRSVLLSAIALTRQDAALEFLFDLIGEESLDAEPAIEAIVRSGASEELVKYLEKLVAGNLRLARVLAAQRDSQKK